jgi:hypothetical protein
VGLGVRCVVFVAHPNVESVICRNGCVGLVFLLFGQQNPGMNTMDLHVLHVLAYCGHQQVYRDLQSPFRLLHLPTLGVRCAGMLLNTLTFKFFKKNLNILIRIKIMC